MNWTSPDASDPIYIDALIRAYAERASIAGSDTVWLSNASPYRSGWAVDFAAAILALSASFVVQNTNSSTKIATPWLSVYSQISDDSELVNLCISAGDMLSGSKSAAFLKAAKHFLDLMTIVEASSTWPALIDGTLLQALVSDFPVDYDPADTAGLAEFLADGLTYAASSAASWTTQIDAKLSAVNFSSSGTVALSAPVLLLYQNDKPLAHVFMMQVYAVTSDPPSYYLRPWDWLSISVAHGDILSTSIPASSATVAIGGATPVAPASPLNWPYDPGNPSGPMYNNTQYLMRLRNFAYDFAVADGFAFRP